MFTGIIEEIGQIIDKREDGLNGGVIWKVKSSFSKELTLGESVAVDGVCHTVTNMDDDSFEIFSSRQTVEITHFSKKDKGDFVNLERSMLLGDRLSGHLVYGHADGVAILESIEDFETSKLLTFKLLDIKQLEYFVNKGSITINGISLTIYEKKKNGFVVMIIDHTYNHTTIQYLENNDLVNIELDIVGKYIKGF